MTKDITVIVVGAALLALVWIGWAEFERWRTETYGPKGDGEQVVCTADAMLCPDGTYVGRTGPKCEFICPGVE